MAELRTPADSFRGINGVTPFTSSVDSGAKLHIRTQLFNLDSWRVYPGYWMLIWRNRITFQWQRNRYLKHIHSDDCHLQRQLRYPFSLAYPGPGPTICSLASVLRRRF